MIYIFWTCRHREEAKKIIHHLLNERWIACASILPDVESIYRWEGKIEESREVKVILKTVGKHFSSIQEWILKHGSYQVPEIAEIHVDQIHSAYSNWVDTNTL